MNLDLPSLPTERDMPAAHVQARKQHLVREAQLSNLPSRARRRKAFRTLPISRRVAIVGIATCVLIGAFVGAASGVGWIFAGHPEMEPAPGTTVTLHQRMMINGHEWAVISYRNSEGKLCLGIKAGGSTGRSCTTEAALFSEGPLAIDTGWIGEGGASGSWVWGVTQPPVTKVTLQFSDCSERTAVVDNEGFFLIVTPGDAKQRQPQRLTAFNESGQSISTKDVPGAKASDCPAP